MGVRVWSFCHWRHDHVADGWAFVNFTITTFLSIHTHALTPPFWSTWESPLLERFMACVNMCIMYTRVYMFVDVGVYADVCVLETSLFIDISPCWKLAECPCNPFLQFHMHTHHWPADLAEASHWWRNCRWKCGGVFYAVQLWVSSPLSPQDHALLVAFLPSVNLELLEIAIVAICKYPHLYPTLDRFQGITPFETWPSLELDHCLIDCDSHPPVVCSSVSWSHDLLPHLPGAAVPEQRNTNHGLTEHDSEDECQVPFVYFTPHWCSSCFLHRSPH